MKQRRSVLVLALVLVLELRADQPLAFSTLVVYNKAVPDSVQLAKFYAQQRNIAFDHVIGLTCSTEEEISREEYDGTIAQPLREIFKTRHWWTMRNTGEREVVTASSIRFIALIKGVPLKIRATTGPYPGDEPGAGAIAGRNEASVDSELSALAFDLRRISGVITNPYFKSYRGITEVGNAPLLLVCRLDAAATSDVRRMIVDAIGAEKKGLWGRAYLDSSRQSAPGYQVGDKWLAEISNQFHTVGVPVVHEDTPSVFPDGYPMTDCSLYYGWYAGSVSGPFAPPDFRFVPGAIAVHIHSFSAATLRDPNANWVAPLVARGAAGSLGNVYEPYLELTTHLDIFNDRLLHGFTFAESAYMSMRGLSWMSVMVGDPLYRPFASWLQIDSPRESAKEGSEWRMYHDFAVKNGSRPASEYRTLARQVASRSRNGPMIEDLGLMEAREGNFASATSYFQQARSCYTKRDDILRVVLEQADTLVKDDKPRRALELIRSVLRIVSEAPAASLLKKIEQDLVAPAPAPALKP